MTKLLSLNVMFRLQLLLGAVGFIVLTLIGRMDYAQALLYGVALMMVNGWWLARRLELTRGLDAKAGQSSLYLGAAMRFVALLAALMLGHLLGLHLLGVAAGMLLAQAVVFICALLGFRKDYKAEKGDGVG